MHWTDFEAPTREQIEYWAKAVAYRWSPARSPNFEENLRIAVRLNRLLLSDKFTIDNMDAYMRMKGAMIYHYWWARQALRSIWPADPFGEPAFSNIPAAAGITVGTLIASVLFYHNFIRLKSRSWDQFVNWYLNFRGVEFDPLLMLSFQLGHTYLEHLPDPSFSAEIIKHSGVDGSPCLRLKAPAAHLNPRNFAGVSWTFPFPLRRYMLFAVMLRPSFSARLWYYNIAISIRRPHDSVYFRLQYDFHDGYMPYLLTLENGVIYPRMRRPTPETNVWRYHLAIIDIAEAKLKYFALKDEWDEGPSRSLVVHPQGSPSVSSIMIQLGNTQDRDSALYIDNVVLENFGEPLYPGPYAPIINAGKLAAHILQNMPATKDIDSKMPKPKADLWQKP